MTFRLTKNNVPIWSAVIAATATLLVGYWQYVRSHDPVKPHRIYGRVKDEGGRPIVGATVKIDEPGVQIASSTTDSGDYFLDIEPQALKERCPLVVKATGYADRTETASPVQLRHRIDFQLRSSDLPPKPQDPEPLGPLITKQLEFLRLEPPHRTRIAEVLTAFKGWATARKP